jgi:hypothetical protein
VTRLLRGAEADVMKNWNTAAAALRIPSKGEATTWIYIGPNGSRFDLEGRNRGRQGVRLAPEIGGAYHLPFEHLFTEGAYQIGSTYERSNINKRVISFAAIIGGPKYSALQYRLAEDNWWDAWPHDTPGWLGAHTMFGGWRWGKVMLAEAVKGSQKADPVAHSNNLQKWDMQVVAPKPFYCKPKLYTTWRAHPQTVAARGYDMETIAIANRSQMPVWPLFLYTGPGRAWVSDGMTNRMVELPMLTSEDGYVLVDTDPANRTLTGSKDPVDNVFYELIRSSRVLDFLLHDISALGLPVWRRGNGVRFVSQIPPRTVANITVKHDNGNGSVTVFMPQQFVRPT